MQAGPTLHFVQSGRHLASVRGLPGGRGGRVLQLQLTVHPENKHSSE